MIQTAVNLRAGEELTCSRGFFFPSHRNSFRTFLSHRQSSSNRCKKRSLSPFNSYWIIVKVQRKCFSSARRTIFSFRWDYYWLYRAVGCNPEMSIDLWFWGFGNQKWFPLQFKCFYRFFSCNDVGSCMPTKRIKTIFIGFLHDEHCKVLCKQSTKSFRNSPFEA